PDRRGWTEGTPRQFSSIPRAQIAGLACRDGSAVVEVVQVVQVVHRQRAQEPALVRQVARPAGDLDVQGDALPGHGVPPGFVDAAAVEDSLLTGFTEADGGDFRPQQLVPLLRAAELEGERTVLDGGPADDRPPGGREPGPQLVPAALEVVVAIVGRGQLLQ